MAGFLAVQVAPTAGFSPSFTRGTRQVYAPELSATLATGSAALTGPSHQPHAGKSTEAGHDVEPFDLVRSDLKDLKVGTLGFLFVISRARGAA